MTLDRVSDNPAGRGGDGAVMRLVAERLAAAGINVRMPDLTDGRCLKIVNAQQARSEVVAEDGGYMLWEYHPWSGPASDPAAIADVVARMLGANIDSNSPHICPRPSEKLKGIVARNLEARGLNVSLEVFEDLAAYDVDADISVRNPARPEHGRVYLSDDGMVTWECQYEITGKSGAAVDALIPVLTGGMKEHHSYGKDNQL